VQYKDQITLFKLGSEVIPGIHSNATAWHTIGHSAFEGSIPNPTDGSGRFFVGGDAVISSPLGVENPATLVSVDQFPEQGVSGRKQLVSLLARRRTRSVFTHTPFPGLGNVGVESKERSTYRWFPAVWRA
jgi:glyoxylase-like metal-dependent hydrolase (beta-lactamase superfamily II)